jgi:serine/threonine protein kinase
MPAPATYEQFLELLTESGIVDEKRLEAFLEQWYVASSVPQDPQELAADMVKGGLLTPFQKDNLLQGKRRGYIIADKYVLLGHLGAGGMGSVYLCEHKVMRRRVALKVLPPKLVAQDPEYLERFHREARAAAALDHPNIVRAHDVDQDDKLHFLVMEYVEGSSLHDIVLKEGPLDVQRAANYISQAATGLEHAHEAGLVHRDIKPGNLLVDRKGTVKILDMGLALFFQEQGESLTTQYDASQVLGTADYLAPEQVGDSHGVDIRADIYSLGLTFFFLLTSKSPYGEGGSVAQKLLWHQLRPAKSVRELRPEVPEELAAIISKMIAKKPGARFQTPGQVVEALAPWVQGTAECVQEAEEVTSPDQEEDAGLAPTESDMAAPTLRRRVAPPETAMGLDRNGPATPTPRGGKTLRAPKSDPPSRQARIDSRDKATAKRPRSSLKNRRGRARSAGFWTTQRLILAGAGAGLLVILTMVAVVWAVIHSRASRSAASGDTNPPSEHQVAQGQPAPSPKTPEPPKTGPAVTPTPEPQPKPPPVQPQPPKPPPEVKKTPLADYYPKPGTTLFYDFVQYDGRTNRVLRQKWEFKDKGIIEATALKRGVVEGLPLLEGGRITWLNAMQAKEQYSYRMTDSQVEFGQHVKQTDSMVWEPVLPLTAAVGDTWKWQLPSGDFKTYTVVKFDQYKGEPSVVIRDSAAFSPDTEIVGLHTYVKGKGEVSRSVSLEKKGAAKQLLGEMKFVDE